jgi:hypothetical protein
MKPLPDFAPPTLAELRAWWLARRSDDVRRLLLEVQHQRLVLLVMRDLIDEGVRQARAVDRELVAGDKPPMRLRVRLAREVLRVGEYEIDDARLNRSPEAQRVRDYARDSGVVAFETEGRMRRRLRNG